MPLMREARVLCAAVSSLTDPAEVLAALATAVKSAGVTVLAALWLPRRAGKVDSYVLDQNLFAHGEVGRAFAIGWFANGGGPSRIGLYARLSVAPVTVDEAKRKLRLTDAEHWIVELFKRHQIRDAVYCPYRNWMLILSSAKVLKLDPLLRFELAMIGQIAVDRLAHLTRKTMLRAKGGAKRLSPREVAVLSYRSHGMSNAAIGDKLKISRRTVDAHLQRAVVKLGAADPAHAMCEALRERLIS